MKPRFSPSCDRFCVKMADHFAISTPERVRSVSTGAENDRFASRRYSLKNKPGDRMIKQLLNSLIAKYSDLSVSRCSNICLSLRFRQIINLLATDKSRYFAQPRPIIVLMITFSLACVTDAQ